MVKSARISLPVVWGKLPSSGDYIRHRINGEQVEVLRHWLSEQHWLGASPHVTHPQTPKQTWGRVTLDPIPSESSFQAHARPWSFVLSPGSLGIARQHWVVGVLAASSDKAGRQYPIVVVQTANQAWLQRHIADPCGWLFHLAQLTMTHLTPSRAHPDQAFVEQVDHLWSGYKPGWSDWFKYRKDTQQLPEPPRKPRDEADQDGLCGVRYLPWAYWPELLWEQTLQEQGWFWQQDALGGFIDAKWLRSKEYQA